jgi:hypothetical protein
MLHNNLEHSLVEYFYPRNFKEHKIAQLLFNGLTKLEFQKTEKLVPSSELHPSNTVCRSPFSQMPNAPPTNKE